jgi:hypothetical protein
MINKITKTIYPVKIFWEKANSLVFVEGGK